MSDMFCQRLPAPDTARGTLLCVHGWGFDHRCWRSLAPLLNADFDLVLVDLPGCGRSACAPAGEWLDYSLHQLSAEVARLAGPVFVLGWSLGGQLALQLSLQCPAVRGVFALATNLQFCAAHHWPAAMDATTYEEFLHQFQVQPQATCKRFAQLVAAGATALPAARKQVRALLAECRPAQYENWWRALQALQTLDLTRAHFDRPAHLLLAQSDQLVPASVQAAAENIAGLTVQTLVGAGHSLPLSEPEQVARWLLGRLS